MVCEGVREETVKRVGININSRMIRLRRARERLISLGRKTLS